MCFVTINSNAQSWLSRQWHNTLAHYNYYFNANELVNDVKEESADVFKDNYKTVLSLYPIPKPEDLKGNAARMDEVLKKCSFIIDKRGKSKWVDDAYLLMGDAHLYKGDLYSAIEVYEFVAGTYKNSEPALHAQINLVRTYILMEKYQDAEALYNKLNGMKNIPAKLKLELDIAGAAVNIKLLKYKNAITLLENAIPKVKNKMQKVRYNFVLAQLYGLNKRKPDALERYRKVIKLNPPYEFAFNAKLNIAKSINIKNKNEVRSAKSVLRNMLKDDKNIDYFDQIYYELGNLELADKNERLAIREYSNCLRAQSSDNGIKSSAYLALADLFFTNQDYENAQVYYDSAAQTILPEHPDYKKVQDKNLVLNELIKHLVNIHDKDSLLRLSEDEKLREKTINMLIKREKEQEELNKQMEENKKIQQENLAMNNQVIGGGFPFYNMAAKNKGMQDFQRIWGNRKHRDYWAITSNSQKVEWGEIDKQQTQNDDGQNIKNELVKNAPEERKKYYQDIPFTKDDKEKMRDEIAESYFLGANVYFQSLKEYEKAKALLEELNKKYPKNNYQVNSWYLLARIHQELNQQEIAQRYIDKIKEADPNSDFLSVLNRDTTSVKNDTSTQVMASAEIDAIYDNAFKAYKLGDYDKAMMYKKENDSKYPGNPLQVNFDYLEALISGRKGEKDAFRKKLEGIAANYPNTDIANQCLKTIELMKIESGEVDASANSKYKYNSSANHFYTLMVPKGFDMTKLKLSFLNYNKSFHAEDELRVTTSLLGDKYQILIVNNFKSMEMAQKYLIEMLGNNKFFDDLKLTESEKQFIISKENFSVLVMEKELEPYISFFKINYKK